MPTRLVLDSRGSFNGAAVCGMSFKLSAILQSVYVVNPLHLVTQILIFRDINGESLRSC